MTLINSLTPEQEALIPVYREKWRAIALSTGRVDRKRAAAVKAAYALSGKQEPAVGFFCSPKAVWKRLGDKLRSQVGNSLILDWRTKFIDLIRNQLEKQLWWQLIQQLEAPLWAQLMRQFSEPIRLKLYKRRHKWRYWYIPCEEWACQSSIFDFCISVLNLTYEKQEWEFYQSLIKNCGWIFPFEKACFVCDRPIKLSFDRENRLHAEGEPAILFTGGFCVYAHYGEIVSEFDRS